MANDRKFVPDESKFVIENIRRVLLKEYMMRQLNRAGFGGLDIQRTPMGTRVTLITERPGLVIGRRGAAIKALTKAIEEDFNFNNPQIEVQQVDDPNLNSQIMAEKLANALERGWHFRRAGHSSVRRIMESGARGCQVILSGKLTGQRHRTEKFRQGSIKYCGDPKIRFLQEGFAVAKLKQGVIGVKVQIMDPKARLPDEVIIRQDVGVPAVEAAGSAAPAQETVPEGQVELATTEPTVPAPDETAAEGESATESDDAAEGPETKTEQTVIPEAPVQEPSEVKEETDTSEADEPVEKPAAQEAPVQEPSDAKEETDTSEADEPVEKPAAQEAPIQEPSEVKEETDTSEADEPVEKPAAQEAPVQEPSETKEKTDTSEADEPVEKPAAQEAPIQEPSEAKEETDTSEADEPVEKPAAQEAPVQEPSEAKEETDTSEADEPVEKPAAQEAPVQEPSETKEKTGVSDDESEDEEPDVQEDSEKREEG